MGPKKTILDQHEKTSVQIGLNQMMLRDRVLVLLELLGEYFKSAW